MAKWIQTNRLKSAHFFTLRVHLIWPNFGPWAWLKTPVHLGLFWRIFVWTQFWATRTQARQNGSPWLNSVHFMNTVARSSVHSKIWSFSIIHQLTLFWFSWCIIENDHISEWIEDRATVFLKWTDFRYIIRFGLHTGERFRVKMSMFAYNFQILVLYLIFILA